MKEREVDIERMESVGDKVGKEECVCEREWRF